jgi:hypothetical protein
MANTVSFLFIAKDKYNKVVQQANRLTAKARKEFRGMSVDVRKASMHVKKLGANMRKAGRSIIGFGKDVALKASAPAAAFTALALSNFNKQEKALAKVANTIRSTGGAAGLTLKQLTDEAVRLQNQTLFGDETILNDATAQLLTFTNIASSEFLRTQQVALDLSTLLDGDLKAASIALGKALNDPIANLGALSRSGIQFSQDQKDVIKALFEVGKKAEAQRVILREIEKQYGGTAAAAAKAGTGPIKQLTNSMGDLTEEIGKVQFEIIRPMINGLKSLTQRFANATPGVKRFVAMGLLVVAALGPIIIGVGGLVTAFGALTFAAGALGTTIGAILAPILLIPATIAAAVVAGTWLYNNFESVREGAKAVIGMIFKMVDAIKQLRQVSIDAVKGGIEKVVNTFSKVRGLVTGGTEKIGQFFTGEPERIKPGQLNTSQSSRTDVNVNLRAPQGAVESVKSRTTGKVSGLNVGVNMAMAQ